MSHGDSLQKGQGERGGNQASSQQASSSAKPSTADAEQPQGENILEGSRLANIPVHV